MVTYFAGNGATSGNTSGTSTAATASPLYNPMGLAIDNNQNLYIAESEGHRIRKVTVSSGTISVIAGTGVAGTSEVGAIASSLTKINKPIGLAVDAVGNIYFAEAGAHMVKMLKWVVSKSTYTFYIIAGTGEQGYLQPSSYVATLAKLNNPYDVYVDVVNGIAKNVYISDTNNHIIRKVVIDCDQNVSSLGVVNSYCKSDTSLYYISTFAGTAQSTSASTSVALEDGYAATSTHLNTPSAFTAFGDSFFIADSYNYRIRRYFVADVKSRAKTYTNGTIWTMAGAGNCTSCDTSRQSTSTCLNVPRAMIKTADIGLVLDSGNNRLLMLSGAPTFMPTPVPTKTPTCTPSSIPTKIPTPVPSLVPTPVPTLVPTLVPTPVPTLVPTPGPTEIPTPGPTPVPTATPSSSPTSVPSASPTNEPSSGPTSEPSTRPSGQPSNQPSDEPSSQPSSKPSAQPTSPPTADLTSQPSSRPSPKPSPRPTSQLSSNSSLGTPVPTDIGLFSADPFDVPWDLYFVKMKIQRYFFYYAAFFVTIFLLLLIIDKSGIIKKYIDSLHESYLHSRVYIPITPMSDKQCDRAHMMRQASINMWGMHLAGDIGDTRQKILLSRVAEEIRKQDKYRWETYSTGTARDDAEMAIVARDTTGAGEDEGGMEMALLSKASSTRLSGSLSAGSTSEQRNVAKLKRLTRLRSMLIASFQMQKKFTREFQEYLVMRRCKLGCADILCPNGYKVPLIGWHLPPGRVEDWLLYVLNNHTIIACIGCARESEHSRNSRRIVLIVSSSVAFFLTNMMEATLRHFSLSNEYESTQSSSWMRFLSGQVVDVFIISPLTLVFAEFCKNLYRCNFGFLKNLQSPILVMIRNAIGAFFSIPLVLFCLGLLVLCAIVTTGNDTFDNIMFFCIQVLLVTVILDFIIAIQNFVSEYHFAVYIFFDSLCILSIGQLYLETLIYEQKVEYSDYYDLSRVFCYGLLRVDRIFEREYAERNGWVKVKRRSTFFTEVNPLHAAASTAVKRSSQTSETPPVESVGVSPMVNNPLTASAVKKPSTVIHPQEVRIVEASPEEQIPAEEPAPGPAITWTRLEKKKKVEAPTGGPTLGVLSPAALSQALAELTARQEMRELREREEILAEFELDLMWQEDEHMRAVRELWWAEEAERLHAELSISARAAEAAHSDEVAAASQGFFSRMSSAARRISIGLSTGVTAAALSSEVAAAISVVDEEEWSQLYSQSEQRMYWRHRVTGEKTLKTPLKSSSGDTSLKVKSAGVQEAAGMEPNVDKTRKVWQERARRASLTPGMHVPSSKNLVD